MKFSLWIFLGIFALIWKINGENIFDLIETHFVSSPREFMSRNELKVKFESYLRNHLDDLRAHPDKTQRIPFILRIPDGCTSECHNKLQKRFMMADTNSNYQPLSTKMGIVTTLFTNIRQYHGSLFPEFQPLIPELKIDKRIQLFFNSDPNDSILVANAAPGECASYFLHVSPLTKEELNKFNKYMASLNSMFPDHTFKYNGEKFIQPFQDQIVFLTILSSSESPSSCPPPSSFDLPLLTSIASRPEIHWILPRFHATTSNRWARGVCQTGSSQYSPFSFSPDTNFTGQGEIIGISDTGIDFSNCYFLDSAVPPPYDKVNLNHRKVVYYDTYADDKENDATAHGTHVSGSVAGFSYLDYGDFKKYNGMAFHAKIAFFDIAITKSGSNPPVAILSIPANINTQLLVPLYNAGARIFTHSWNTENDNAYSSYSANVDQFMWNNPDAVVFFSAGNSGQSASNPSQSVPHTVWSPATFKNGVTLGASSNDHKSWLAYGQSESFLEPSALGMFSSRGPTADNRLKPDITASGAFTTSAQGYYNTNYTSPPHCTVQALDGTSMASPTAAGNAALVRQYLLQGYYPTGVATPANSFIPSGSLLKALLVASAQPLTTEAYSANNGVSYQSNTLSGYPSNNQGYGRIQLNKVLNIGHPATTTPLKLFLLGSASNSQPHYAQIIDNQQLTYPFSTNSMAQMPIRIVLSYTDYPGTAGSSSSSAMINILTLQLKNLGTGVLTAPYLLSQGTNLQVIDFNPSPSSNYQVIISCGTLVHSPQPFSLVIVGNITMIDSNDMSMNTDDGVVPDSSYTVIHTQMKIAIALLAVIAFGLGTVYLLVFRDHRAQMLRHKNGYAPTLNAPAAEALRVAQQMERLEREQANYRGGGGGAGGGARANALSVRQQRQGQTMV